MTHDLVGLVVIGTTEDQALETVHFSADRLVESQITQWDSWATWDGETGGPVYPMYRDIKGALESDNPGEGMWEVVNSYPEMELFTTQLQEQVGQDLYQLWLEGALDQVDKTEEDIKESFVGSQDWDKMTFQIFTSPSQRWGELPTVVQWQKSSEKFSQVASEVDAVSVIGRAPEIWGSHHKIPNNQSGVWMVPVDLHR